MTAHPTPVPIVLMGVSGSGKSTIGELLADATGRPFVDGDELHPAANKAKMAAGHPLSDEDRLPWLRLVGERLAAGDAPIVACSALKLEYRELLRSFAENTYFAHLSGSKELLAARLAGRHGHFMPPALLDSQLATLEPLGPDERGGVYDIAEPAEKVAREIVAATEASKATEAPSA